MLDGRQYVLWGSAGHAKVLHESIQRLGGQVIGLFDNNPDAKSSIPGIPLLGGRKDFAFWIMSRSDRQKLHGLVAIGGARGGIEWRYRSS